MKEPVEKIEKKVLPDLKESTDMSSPESHTPRLINSQESSASRSEKKKRIPLAFQLGDKVKKLSIEIPDDTFEQILEASRSSSGEAEN